MPDCGFLEKKDTVPLTFVSAQWIFAIGKGSPVNDSLGKGGCWEPRSNFNNTCLNQSLFLTQPSKVFHRKTDSKVGCSQFSRWFIHSTIKDISGIQGALLGRESRGRNCFFQLQPSGTAESTGETVRLPCTLLLWGRNPWGSSKEGSYIWW